MKLHTTLLTIQELLTWAKHWFNPETIVKEGGLALLLFVLFAETGLFVGFFLPGDSLLFVAGLAVSQGWMDTNLFVAIFLATCAAIIGNFVGYFFGWHMGPRLFKKEDSLIFKKKYLEMTEAFYEKHGKKAIILGRFVPIMRTFVPILGGAIKMNFGNFAVYNILGAVLWVPTLMLAGYWLGQFAWVRNNIELIVIGLIVITIIPVIRTYIKERKAHKERNQA